MNYLSEILKDETRMWQDIIRFPLEIVIRSASMFVGQNAIDALLGNDRCGTDMARRAPKFGLIRLRV